MTGSPPALRVAGLTARFGGDRGLAGLSLAVEAGERLVVVGASGAGKTTLLRAIAGLTPMEAGTVEVAGRDVTALPAERRGVVYLHQTPVLFPHLSVFENVAFALRVRRVPDAVVRARVAALLAAVRLAGFESRAPRTLSGGQRHRVALARAVAASPAVLLLDEPLSSLDPALRDEVREAILAVQRELAAPGGAPGGAPGVAPALVVVTHDFDEAGLLGDRIAVLVDRAVAQVAAPAELFRRPASLAVARFLGVANELRGVIAPDGTFHSALGALSLGGSPPRPAGPATAVFHAEALAVVAAGGGGAAARGCVVALRHRAHRTTARVRVGSVELEVAVDPVRPPAPGDEVGVGVDTRQLVLFASDAASTGA